MLQHCDSTSVSHLSHLVLKTAPVGGLAPDNSNYCRESPFSVTGFDLLLAAQNPGCKPQSVGLLLRDSSLSSFPEKRSFIPKGIFSDFIEKALICCCCFPKNDLKTFDI